MDLEQRTLRLGLTAILCAAVFRLCSLDPGVGMQRLPGRPMEETKESIQQTGQPVRSAASYGSYFPDFVETPAPAFPELPWFPDASQVEVYYARNVKPSLDALIQKPLQWSLAAEQPTVLILHTHTTESYTQKGEGYRETSAYRTLDERYNMLSIGDLVADLLRERGIRVIHDRNLHDYPSYNGSYSDSRKTAREYLEQYPGIRLILDLHRDASDGTTGQLRTLAASEQTPCAQLMVVIGTNHDAYEENLSLGLKLHAQLERQSPGITRPLQLRSQRFNQDLLPGMLLIEVGAAGNTHQEALEAARQLALAVIALGNGTRDAEDIPEEAVRNSL